MSPEAQMDDWVTVTFPPESQMVTVWVGDGIDPLVLRDEMTVLDLPPLSGAQMAVASARLRYWADAITALVEQ